MPYHIHIKRLTPPRAWLLTPAAILSVALSVGGCGSSSSRGVAHVSSGKGASSEGASSQGASAASSESGGPSPESKGQAIGQALIAYAKCMRSHGVPSFPDPNPGGGMHVGAGTESSPAFKAAQAKCQKLMPGGGGPPGSGSPPSAQTMAHWLEVSQCMRKHRVSGFPDPATSAPSKAGGSPNGVAIDREGAIFALSVTIMQSPAFKQAAARCNLR